jgi:hypothetical protein
MEQQLFEQMEHVDPVELMRGLVGRTITGAGEIEDDNDGHGIVLELDDGRDLVFYADEEEGLIMVTVDRDEKPVQ